MNHVISLIVAVLFGIGLSACGATPEDEGSPGGTPATPTTGQLHPLPHGPVCRSRGICPQ